jgi:HSP20 family protein
MNDLRIKDWMTDVDPFETAFRDLLRPWRVGRLQTAAPQIRLDVDEADAEYLVKAEIPGVRKEDIDVRIDGNQVTISAEVKKESEEQKGSRVLRSERQYGYASRSFMLDSPVDESKADAKYQNGVLQLKLPKRAQEAKKKLTIA